MNLNKYKKEKNKLGRKVSSVNLTPEQVEFVKKNDINLSMLIRDYLDGLIEEARKPKKK